MSGIILHKEHGLNPTMPVCAWCGKEKGEIALLGAAYKGKAPMRMIMDYEPCEECKAGMALGITFVEASPTPIAKGQMPFSGGYPTGRWSVITEEAFERNFKDSLDKELYDSIVKARLTLMEPEVYQQVFGDAQPQQEG